jgi:hypothetical protein
MCASFALALYPEKQGQEILTVRKMICEKEFFKRRQAS